MSGKPALSRYVRARFDEEPPPRTAKRRRPLPFWLLMVAPALVIGTLYTLVQLVAR